MGIQIDNDLNSGHLWKALITLDRLYSRKTRNIIKDRGEAVKAMNINYN